MEQYNNIILKQNKLASGPAINKGFTLIELVIVIGVIAISLPIIFGLFFLNLQAQSRIYILQEVKRNGDYSLNVMQNLIKQYGKELYSDSTLTIKICEAKDSSYTGNIYIKDKFVNSFYFQLDTTKIASMSTALGTGGLYGRTYLTNDKVQINSLTISCSRTSAFSPPSITVSFTVSQAGTPARHEEKASLNYQAKIKLKSY